MIKVGDKIIVTRCSIYYSDLLYKKGIVTKMFYDPQPGFHAQIDDYHRLVYFNYDNDDNFDIAYMTIKEYRKLKILKCLTKEI